MKKKTSDVGAEIFGGEKKVIHSHGNERTDRKLALAVLKELEDGLSMLRGGKPPAREVAVSADAEANKILAAQKEVFNQVRKTKGMKEIKYSKQSR